MQKTRLGISVGLLGAAVYFASLFSGYLVAIILAGYVLLFEEDEWLKKNAVKAVATLMLFSCFTTVTGLLSDALGFVGEIFDVFHGYFIIAFLLKIVRAVTGIIGFIKTVLFFGLGINALRQGSIPIPVVDPLIDKYM